MFELSRLRPVISVRLTLLMRTTAVHGVLVALAWITHLSGRSALGYFFVLWIVPLLTSFSFFMMLRPISSLNVLLIVPASTSLGSGASTRSLHEISLETCYRKTRGRFWAGSRLAQIPST